MSGPGHYQEAERLLERASEEEYGTPAERYVLASAQVHATLALAAATAATGFEELSRTTGDWGAAIGVVPS